MITLKVILYCISLTQVPRKKNFQPMDTLNYTGCIEKVDNFETALNFTNPFI